MYINYFELKSIFKVCCLYYFR